MIIHFLTLLYSESVVVTNPPTIPCVEGDPTSVVGQLSCMARSNSLYLMANYCNLDGDQVWNSNLVFDNHGALIAEYRKSHVWNTKIFDTPPEPDYVTFTASFASGNQRLGMFMCKDILYPTPGPALRKEGVVSFAYNAFIDFSWVSTPAFKLWSWQQSAVLIAANAQAGVFVNGTSIGKAVENIVIAAVPFTA